MKPIEILLVEDNPGDARLTREALAHSKVRNNLHHARDGEEAIAFLRREGAFGNAPTPDLVLLDLNLPRRDGREVLEDIHRANLDGSEKELLYPNWFPEFTDLALVFESLPR